MSVLLMPGLRLHTCQKVASLSLVQTTRAINGRYQEVQDGRGRTVRGDPMVQRVSAEEDGPEFRFITVRHPLDRLVSCWAFFCSPQERGVPLVARPQYGLDALGYYGDMPFGAFLEIALARHASNDHTRKQIIAAGPHAGKACLCRLDALSDAWPWMMERFPFLLPITVQHRSRRQPWADMYSPAMRAAAEAVFSEDLALFERATNGDPNGQAAEFQAA